MKKKYGKRNVQSYIERIQNFGNYLQEWFRQVIKEEISLKSDDGFTIPKEEIPDILRKQLSRIQETDPATFIPQEVQNKEVEEESSIFVKKLEKTRRFAIQLAFGLNLSSKIEDAYDGEHIDYCGYGVCPMAIEQCAIVAVSTNQMSQINISNTKTDLYPFFILVDGDIPPSAGLSSSSALVCASAVVIYHMFSPQEISANNLADLCGNGSGGVIPINFRLCKKFLSFLACSIEFDPLRTSLVTLPKGMSFVVANSGVKMNKAATFQFNTRVAECRLAAMLISKRKSKSPITKLASLQILLGSTLEEMIDIVKSEFHTYCYTRAEIASELEMEEGDLIERVLPSNLGHGFCVV
ncbi:N-acetylgalactosamine kinase-like [Octopus sinensis]|uniref:N-acetylgalactosamine kinase-like n=1 Tax=Octopus sinensis TaxID=2607531 RepID=A0A7E6EKQ3_9MOLL|nr:N-acetylgalactosamine kinase-like [Octopus sinensis]